VSFDAVIPPQAANLAYFLPTTVLTVTQKFDKPLTGLRVGDTITRTVTITAANLRAMLIPPIQLEAPDGIAVYPKEPIVDDIKTSRGEFVEGKRVDSATYLIRKEGNYRLPAIEIQWWNLAANKLQTATLSATHFDAAPNLAYHPELAPEPAPVATPPPARVNSLRRYLRVAEVALLAAVTLGICLWLLLHFGPQLRRRWIASRATYRNSEVAHFARLCRACRAAKSKDAYKALIAWVYTFSPGSSLDRFLVNWRDADLTDQVQSLTAMLYGNSILKGWSGQQMVDALQRVRMRRRCETRNRSSLPALNPTTNKSDAVSLASKFRL
jgi:hypothetical protein